MNSLEMKNVSISYGDRLIIDDMSLKIPKGKITTIVGPNGCGKSTCLKTMGRILNQQSGDIYLNGQDMKALNTKDIAKRMAILPQGPQAPGGLTVEELVSYGRYPYKKKYNSLTDEDMNIVNWSLNVTKLTDLKERQILNLSGGQRQRVWIAMAIAQQTDLILLDEPTTYLDMTYQLEVLELLYKLNREEGRTIVMVLHDLNLASRFADHMVAMKDGKIIREGSPTEIMTKEVLKETFDVDAYIAEDINTERKVCVSYNLLN